MKESASEATEWRFQYLFLPTDIYSLISIAALL